MEVHEAQREIRRSFLGGFAGQLVSGALWLLAAATATWGTRRATALVVILGGFLIFPMTLLLLRALGRPPRAGRNPLDQLAMQVAFIVPLGLPLVGAAALHRPHWFFPALMLVVGAHYLPFVFLYGMPQFALLGGLLVSGGLALGLWAPPSAATLGAWGTGAVLVLFAFEGLRVARREAARA